MQSNDKVEIEISTKSAKLAVTGESAKVVTSDFRDIAKPFVHAFGMAGDWMEYQRTKLYNQRSAEKALILAKELIEEQGKTVEPTNPKILAPWLEGVSLEDRKMKQ